MPDSGKDFLAASAFSLQSGKLDSLRRLGIGTGSSEAYKKVNSLKPLHGGPGSAESAAQIKDASKQFEALLLQQMLQAMWQTVPQGDLISGSREEGLYRDMLNDAVAKSVSQGRGIGVADIIAKDMKRLQESRK